MTGPDLSFLFVEPFVYAVTFWLTAAFGLLFGWVLVKVPGWLLKRKQRQMERFYYGPQGEVTREALKLGDPGIHRPYWR